MSKRARLMHREEDKTMSCKRKDIKNLMPPYIERTLEAEQLIMVEAHLDECQDCRKELAILKLLAAESIPEPGEAFWQGMPDRIMAKIEREMTPHSRRSGSGLSRLLDRLIQPRLAWSVAASVIAALVIWGVVAYYQAETKTQASVSPEVFLEDEYYPVSGIVAFEEANDIQALSAWADAGLKEISDQVEMVLNNADNDMYEDLFSLSNHEMKKLRKIIDELR